MTELEVTGVSRSGRVRKKSSKLTDFESLDEIDIRTNTRIKKEKYEATSLPAVSRPIKKERLVKEEILSDVEESELSGSNYQVKQEHYSDDSDNDGYGHNDDSSMDSLGSEMEDMDDSGMDRGDGNGFQHIAADDSSDEASSQQRGLYKNNKKKLFIKDGKIMGKMKTPKKDNKAIWKKRANKASAIKRQYGNANQTRPTMIAPAVTLQDQQSSAGQIRKGKSSPTRRFVGKQTQQQQQQPPQQHSHHQQVLAASPQVVNTSSTPTSVSSEIKTQSKSAMSVETSVFKPVSTSALDVAAHLKLLGESLTIIGERLTEHEGQIAVSGSFSVLLDSLLCALGPLLCLTQQVPQMNVVPQEQLSQIMDNIAYIMPGL